MVFSAMLCGLKLGLSLGGALVAAILAAYHYDPDLAVQTPEAVRGIRLSVSVFCSIPFLVGILLLFLYEIDKKTETRIEQELGARRAQAASAA
jgi:Na+/melibiose symporter-like transporter